MSAAHDTVDHRTRSCITVRPRAYGGASALLQDRGEVDTAHECTSPAGDFPTDGLPKCPVVDVNFRASTDRHGPVEATTFDERRGDRDGAHESRVTIWWLRPHTTIANASFLVRGPYPFPRALTPGLKAADNLKVQTFFEPVGPADGSVSA